LPKCFLENIPLSVYIDFYPCIKFKLKVMQPESLFRFASNLVGALFNDAKTHVFKVRQCNRRRNLLTVTVELDSLFAFTCLLQWAEKCNDKIIFRI